MNDKLKEEIRKTLGILKNGGVILYPTDTIWGLGCDATNPEAVKRIYDIKKRADNKSMLVLLDDAGKIASYADVPDIALDLIEVADKPTTIIYPFGTQSDRRRRYDRYPDYAGRIYPIFNFPL